MTRDEANNLAATLCGLMPKITDEQSVEIRDVLLGVKDAAAAMGRLRTYAGERGEFDLPSAKRAAAGPAVGDSPAVARTRQYLDSYERDKAHLARVDMLIAAMDYDDAERRAAAVLPCLPSETVTLAKRRGWRAVRSVRLAIVEEIDRESGVLPPEPQDNKTLSTGADHG